MITIDLYHIARIIKPVIDYELNKINSNDKALLDTLYKTSIISYLVALGYTPNMAIKTYEEYQNNKDTDYIQ